jgi:hypothetical protein
MEIRRQMRRSWPLRMVRMERSVHTDPDFSAEEPGTTFGG